MRSYARNGAEVDMGGYLDYQAGLGMLEWGSFQADQTSPQ